MNAPPQINIFTLNSRPGIKRDGTDLDNDYYQDGLRCYLSIKNINLLSH